MNKRKIKVIHVGDKFGKAGATVHGVTRLFAWWFARWDTSEFDVDLVGLRAPDEAHQKLQQLIPGLTSLNKGKFDPSTVTSLVRLIRERRADIVHLHGYGAHNFGRLAARVTGVPIVIHEHFVDPGYPGYQSIADRMLGQSIDWGFAVSKSVKEFMSVTRHMPADKIEVLYNGAPLQEFQLASAAAVVAEKAKWGIAPDEIVLGTVGRLDPQKGNTYLLKALPQLLAKGHKIKLMIIGDGPLRDALKTQCGELGIERHVIFAGYQSDIPLIQSLFDVQVFPSLYEGTPLTMFEAMTMGRAIVSTNVDGLGEVLIDGANAMLVPPQDADALAAALAGVLGSPQRRADLGARAHNDAKAFDAQNMVNRMQAVYLQLVRDNPPHAAFDEDEIVQA